MAYSDFTLKDAIRKLNLTLVEDPVLFAAAPEVEPGAMITALLEEYVTLALAINTEKARSEFIIAPLLAEIRRRAPTAVSLFSGVDFGVAPEKGLVGVCDFLLTHSPEQQFVTAPVLTVVEAKNDNPKSGFGQCIASMVGARLFNDRENTTTPTVYGAVTTGTLWRFLTLTGDSFLRLDPHEYHIERLPKIMGILLYAIGSQENAH